MTIKELKKKVADETKYYQNLVDKEKDLNPKTANYKTYTDALEILKGFKYILNNEELVNETVLKLIETQLEINDKSLIV